MRQLHCSWTVQKSAAWPISEKSGMQVFCRHCHTIQSVFAWEYLSVVAELICCSCSWHAFTVMFLLQGVRLLLLQTWLHTACLLHYMLHKNFHLCIMCTWLLWSQMPFHAKVFLCHNGKKQPRYILQGEPQLVCGTSVKKLFDKSVVKVLFFAHCILCAAVILWSYLEILKRLQCKAWTVLKFSKALFLLMTMIALTTGRLFSRFHLMDAATALSLPCCVILLSPSTETLLFFYCVLFSYAFVWV